MASDILKDLADEIVASWKAGLSPAAYYTKNGDVLILTPEDVAKLVAFTLDLAIKRMARGGIQIGDKNVQHERPSDGGG